MEAQKIMSSQSNLQQKVQAGGITRPELKTQFRASVTKTAKGLNIYFSNEGIQMADKMLKKSLHITSHWDNEKKSHHLTLVKMAIIKRIRKK